MPTVKEFLGKAGDLRLDAEVILTHEFSQNPEKYGLTAPIDRSFLAAHPEVSVPGEAVAKFLRRKNGEPLAYILGEKEFFDRKFKVDKNVLIPRPETETVVEMVLERIKKAQLDDGQFVMVIDVGTGSGAIAATVDLEAEKPTYVVGLDLSPAALDVADENCDRLGARVKLMESDLLEVFDEGIKSNGELILVANLPYVSRDWNWTSPELKYEPSEALYAEDGGLRTIFDFLEQVNNKVDEGYVVLEADPSQHAQIRQKVEALGLRWLRSQDFAIEIEI